MGSDPTPYDDDEAPLSTYEEVLGDAPANDTLPDENKADAVYPRLHTELIASQSSVKSQARRGVCSIFAAVGLMEHLYLEAGAEDPDFSEQFLQWSVKKEVGDYATTEGSNASSNLAAIKRFGIVAELDWPYQPDRWTDANDVDCGGTDSTKPTKCWTNGDPPETAMAATRFKLPTNKYLNTNSIKSHITTKGTAVVIGLDFFYQSWNHRLSTLPISPEYWRMGYVTNPNEDDVTESHKQRAGHAIVIVGWDDDLEVPMRDKDGNQILDASGNPKTEKGFYIIKNSWGTAGFGIENPHGAGYGYLSMKYVNRYGSAQVSDRPILDTPPPPPPVGEHYEKTAAATIPDNNAAGITSVISVPASGGTVQNVTVTVDITHTWIGDLRVTLSHGGKTATLHANTGGSEHDIKKTYTLTDFVGQTKGGDWTLSVRDNANQDVGTLNKWSLDL